MIRLDYSGNNPRQVFRIFDTSEFPFPSHAECWRCEGSKGTDTRPRSGGDRMEPDDYYWDECPECDGAGEKYNPTAKAIRRRTIRREVARLAA